MKTITFHTTALETNTYLALNGERAFVVDPGADADKILAAAEAEGAKIEWVLLTHAHFDHIGGVAELQRAGAQVVLHRDDLGIVSSFKNLAFYAGVKVEKFLPDVTVSGGETLDVAGVKVRVIHTPGHTAGGVCYVFREGAQPHSHGLRRADDKFFLHQRELSQRPYGARPRL